MSNPSWKTVKNIQLLTQIASYRHLPSPRLHTWLATDQKIWSSTSYTIVRESCSTLEIGHSGTLRWPKMGPSNFHGRWYEATTERKRHFYPDKRLPRITSLQWDPSQHSHRNGTAAANSSSGLWNSLWSKSAIRVALCWQPPFDSIIWKLKISPRHLDHHPPYQFQHSRPIFILRGGGCWAPNITSRSQIMAKKHKLIQRVACDTSLESPRPAQQEYGVKTPPRYQAKTPPGGKKFQDLFFDKEHCVKRWGHFGAWKFFSPSHYIQTDRKNSHS